MDHDLLVRLDERTQYIVLTLDEIKKHADNGGWSRCKEREGQVKTLEENQKEHRKGHSWTIRLVVTIILTQIAAMVM